MVTNVRELGGFSDFGAVRLSRSPIVNEGKRRGGVVRIMPVEEDECLDNRSFRLVIGCHAALIRSTSLARWDIKVHASVAIFQMLVLEFDTLLVPFRTFVIGADIDKRRTDGVRAQVRIEFWQDLNSFVRKKTKELLLRKALINCFFVAAKTYF